MLDETSVPSRMWNPPRLGLGAIAAVALVAGFAAWLLLRDGSTGKPATPAASAQAVARLVTPPRLRLLASRLGYPLYWIGRKSGMRYELTRATGGNTFIRYLPSSARAGDPRAAFLAIGTYPVRNPFAQIQAATRRPGAVTIRLAGGGLAVYDQATPTSVYFAYPGSKVQVEVYDPSARNARSLVLGGQAVPIR
jgi:hypothetical protein